MTLLEQFIELLYSQVDRAIYVWGGRGEIVPDDAAERAAFFARKETSDGDHTKAENIARCERLYQRRKSAGVSVVRAFDCSGLIYYGLSHLKLLNTRMSSRGYYSYCKENTDKTGSTPYADKVGDTGETDSMEIVCTGCGYVSRDVGFPYPHCADYFGISALLE